jgi:hypothetical protein
MFVASDAIGTAVIVLRSVLPETGLLLRPFRKRSNLWYGRTEMRPAATKSGYELIAYFSLVETTKNLELFFNFYWIISVADLVSEVV